MTTPPVLSCRGIVRDLGDEIKTRVLHNIELSVTKGEFVALTGASGSGKSTLLYLLGALDRPTSGDIFIDGEEIARMSEDQRARVRREKLGFVFQFHFLLPEFTLLENVCLPMWRRGAIPRSEAEDRAKTALDRLGLGKLGHRKPHQISGGQQQRVSIARAIANAPRVLMADEPTGNLDSASALGVMEIFEELTNRDGMTIVMVTHEPSFARRTHRELRLRDGRIVDILGHRSLDG